MSGADGIENSRISSNAYAPRVVLSRGDEIKIKEIQSSEMTTRGPTINEIQNLKKNFLKN